MEAFYTLYKNAASASTGGFITSRRIFVWRQIEVLRFLCADLGWRTFYFKILYRYLQIGFIVI